MLPRHRRTAPDRRTRPRHRPLLDAAAATALATRPRCLYLDLAGLTFCDHTGLRALHRLTHQASAAHVSLRLTGIHPRLHRTLTQQRTPPSPRYVFRGPVMGPLASGPGMTVSPLSNG
ncbi:STAS domain-containing protein [Streptomyces sp. NPDC058664]|uniref:STAS domain-containing protein n=1 Tax=unclassified Streptomyces TaxID=2593676 RepID=UPI00365D5272